jgi:phosphopantetheinyl transferase
MPGEILRLLIGKMFRHKPGRNFLSINEFGKPGIADSNSAQFNIPIHKTLRFAFTKKLKIFF